MPATSRYARSSGILLCLFALQAPAAMYKWVDEDGVTHYSQQPPPAGVESQTIKPQGIGGARDEQARERRQQYIDELTGGEEEKDKAAAGQQQEAGPSPEEKRENCRKARARLQSFQNPRVNFVDKDGTRRRATEEERQRELQRAREYIQKHCN